MAALCLHVGSSHGSTVLGLVLDSSVIINAERRRQTVAEFLKMFGHLAK